MQKANPAECGFDPARLGRIAPWMDRYIDERKFAGASVLIAQGGQEVYCHTCGTRDIASGAPFARDTVARIYSMTKPITSVALMMLVERGEFHLDAPLSAFLPEFSQMQSLIAGAERIDQTEPCACPTLHQMLTHTAGFSYAFNPGVLPGKMEEERIDFGPARGPLADMSVRVAALPLAFQPGSRWEYSVAIDLLGRVIEVVTGKTLAQVFDDDILGPLGMRETGFSVPDGTAGRFAGLYSPHAQGGFSLKRAPEGGETLHLAEAANGSQYHDATMYSGGGGLVGTIDDYMRFAEMIRRGGQAGTGADRTAPQLLSAATLRFMMRNHLRGDIASMGPQSFAEQPMDGIGFGIGGSTVLDPALARVPGSVGDFSWGGMASTFFWVDPVQDISAVFFTQLLPSSSYPARAELKALVHAALRR